MRNITKTIPALLLVIATAGCTDDDSFTTRTDHMLTFAQDTVSMDTVFSRVPTSRKSFWIYNKSGDGIRCTNVRLANGNQSGFRVNIDGTYLGEESGYQISDLEIRRNDSVFVNLELTARDNNKIGPQYMEDNLVFQLESGVQQKVNLNAYSWDAEIIKNLTIKGDTLITSQKPIVVYGPLTIDSLSTTTIAPGTTLYFHNNGKLDVYGRLVANGTPDRNIVFRTDRTEHMFSYLPYDMVSGMWNGIHFHTSSYSNVMDYTDTHGCFNGIVCDSSDVSRQKLSLTNSIVHNCQGYGLKLTNCNTSIKNCQLSNVLNDCVAVIGGQASILSSTIAQFYPFDSNYGAALSFTNQTTDDQLLKHTYPLLKMDCVNSIVTGYADDVVMGSNPDTTAVYTFMFENCILRTDSLEQSENVKNVIWEKADSVETDTVYGGKKNFKLVDGQTQHYDFHLSPVSKAIGAASTDAKYALQTDREGTPRDSQPDMGCYEYVAPAGEDDKSTQGATPSQLPARSKRRSINLRK